MAAGGREHDQDQHRYRRQRRSLQPEWRALSRRRGCPEWAGEATAPVHAALRSGKREGAPELAVQGESATGVSKDKALRGNLGGMPGRESSAGLQVHGSGRRLCTARPNHHRGQVTAAAPGLEMEKGPSERRALLIGWGT